MTAPTITTPPGALYLTAAAFRRALEARDQAAADAMLRAWTIAHQRILQDQAALLAKIAEARAAGVPVTRGWLYQQDRYKALLATVRSQVDQFTVVARLVAAESAAEAVRMAEAHAARLVTQAATEALPGVSYTFTGVNPQNLQRVVEFTASRTSPLTRLLKSLGDDAAKAARNALLHGLAQGWSAEKIARELSRATAMPLRRARLVARTETLRAYRETTRLAYEANADVVTGWEWSAALDGRTCAACIAMSGTVHPNSERLDGHPNCRCAPVPVVVGSSRVILSGEDWLRSQAPRVQRGVLGAKYGPWAAGEISLDDVVGRRFDPDWGTMRYERSMAAIRASRTRRR